MYRVCFAGDSVFVIREIEPEAQVAPIWASFCGHMFAVAGLIHEMDEAMARRIEIWPVEKLNRPAHRAGNRNTESLQHLVQADILVDRDRRQARLQVHP